MSYDEYDVEYSNGACGECQSCGAATAEAWHAYCSDCYAEQNGWKRPARPEPGTDPPSFVVALTDVRRELAELRRRLERLEGAA